MPSPNGRPPRSARPCGSSQPATFGSFYLDPIPHWPNDGYLKESLPEGPLVVVPEKAPLVITLDVVMPRKDGWAELSALKADPELGTKG